MLKNALLGTLVVGLLLAGCGSNDDKKDDGAAGSGAGASAAGTNGGGGTSGSLATGGSGGAGGSPLMPMCDTAASSVTMCGSESCPAVDTTAAMYCMVNCCISGKCGTQRAIAGDSQYDTECQPPVQEDPRCPDQMIQSGKLKGCCTTDNQCGIIDSFLTHSCVANGKVPSIAGGPFPERACDDEGDAGTN